MYNIINCIQFDTNIDIDELKYEQIKTLTKSLLREYLSIDNINSNNKYYNTMRFIIINIMKSVIYDKPIRYSRDTSWYKGSGFYGYKWYSYKKMIELIDWLHENSLIEHEKGYYNFITKEGLQSKFWYNAKFLSLMKNHEIPLHELRITRKKMDVPIRLKNRDGVLVKYPITIKVRNMNDFLEQYNEYINKSSITLNLSSNMILTSSELKNLYVNVGNGHYIIKSIYYNSTNTRVSFLYLSNLDKQININQNIDVVGFTRFLKEVIGDGKKEVNVTLSELGFKRLEIILSHLYLYRVFNRNSLKYGGRFYGASHIEMKSKIRKYIHIDNEPTIELDYSGLHIRMLYHMKGIDYKDECYIYKKGENDVERTKLKIVSLIIINSENEENANKAIPKKFRKEGLEHEKDESKRLINKFKLAHIPIIEFLCSDIGITLQYKDSCIMEAVLKSLMENNILALPVHDSIIVKKRHEEIARQTMIDEYKKKIGFEPIIDID